MNLPGFQNWNWNSDFSRRAIFIFSGFLQKIVRIQNWDQNSKFCRSQKLKLQIGIPNLDSLLLGPPSMWLHHGLSSGSHWVWHVCGASPGSAVFWGLRVIQRLCNQTSEIYLWSEVRLLYLPPRLSTLQCLRLLSPSWNWSKWWKITTYQSSALSHMSTAKFLKTIQERWNLPDFPSFVHAPSILTYVTTIFVSMYTKDKSGSSLLVLLIRLLTCWHRL